MNCLAGREQDRVWRTTMNKTYSVEIVNESWQPRTGTSDNTRSEALTVNVVFTHERATIAALKAALVYAQSLGARIHLRAAIVVPLRLPLNEPQVSVDFMENKLCELVGHAYPNGCDCTVHLYVCRNWADTLSQVLKPGSLVVIGGRRRWWPTEERRMADRLQAQGHHVTLVNPEDSKAAPEFVHQDVPMETDSHRSSSQETSPVR